MTANDLPPSPRAADDDSGLPIRMHMELRRVARPDHDIEYANELRLELEVMMRFSVDRDGRKFERSYPRLRTRERTANEHQRGNWRKLQPHFVSARRRQRLLI